jgi:hypothetical protein
MRTSHVLFLATILAATSRAQEETQTDWSGGAAPPVPVEEWGDAFEKAGRTSWRSVPGQVALSSERIATPPGHTIALTQQGFGVRAVDLDGDGDIDVVGTSDGANQVLWWRNDGGSPPSFTEEVIDPALSGANGLYTGDFDLDGRLDVVASGAGTGHEIVCYRNGGGSPISWTKQVIDPNWGSCFEVSVADVNLDGRPDVLAASWNGNRIAWWENTGGDPIVWVRDVIDFTTPGMHCVRAGDIDGDGDIDTVATAGQADIVTWWRNDGGDPIVWTKHPIRTGFTGGRSVALGDIDEDGDLDIVGTAWTSEVTWWRNDGGDPIVWTEDVIDGAVVGGHHVRLNDINGDGKLDILVAAFMDNDVLWYENAGGNPIEWQKRTVAGGFTLPIEVGAADIDGDGALDIVASSYSPSGRFRWWEPTEFKPAGNLESSILDTKVGLSAARIDWDAEVPTGTSLRLSVRSSDDPGNLGSWSAPMLEPGILGDLGRYVQYLVQFSSSNPDLSPILREIRFDPLEDWVVSERRVSEGSGGFSGPLDARDSLGISLANLGDLDGDGNQDMLAGAMRDDDGGSNIGALWILFFGDDGDVMAQQKISATAGGFGGALSPSDAFATSAAPIGDLDGDGVVDLAVGAWLDDDGGMNRGAVWILFLNADGTVKAEQKISSTAGGLVGPLHNGDGFAYSLDSIGDLDSDGVDELAVGVMWDDDGGLHRGAIYILFLNPDGTVRAEQKISQTAGGFGGTLSDEDTIGVSVTGLGDLDGDGIPDIASGADHDDDGGDENGAVWVLFLNADGTVKAEQKISATEGNFPGPLANDSFLGIGVAAVGDVNHDGVVDLAVGLVGVGASPKEGGVWILFLDTDGTVKDGRLIGSTDGGFEGELLPNGWFGYSISGLGDFDGNGSLDIAVAAPFDSGDAIEQGAFWLLEMKSCFISNFCASSPNSAGAGASIGMTGTASVATNDFTLTVDGAVPGQFGLFFYGSRQTDVPFGDGSLCIAGGGCGLFRLPPVAITDAAGHAEHQVDFSAPPVSSGPGWIAPGSKWYFQYWYRDPAAGGSGFNLSDGLAVGFCP